MANHACTKKPSIGPALADGFGGLMDNVHHCMLIEWQRIGNQIKQPHQLIGGADGVQRLSWVRMDEALGVGPGQGDYQRFLRCTFDESSDRGGAAPGV